MRAVHAEPQSPYSGPKALPATCCYVLRVLPSCEPAVLLRYMEKLDSRDLRGDGSRVLLEQEIVQDIKRKLCLCEICKFKGPSVL